ncbi:MAG: penicillin acylase family protein, partial [Sphingorhabdus sp.]
MGVAKKIGWSALAVVSALAVSGLVWEPLAATDQSAPAKRAYDVEIVRDEFGVPHINGKTDADTAYGLAFAHSEDDFGTIQEVVSMARGRYGAMIGSDG